MNKKVLTCQLIYDSKSLCVFRICACKTVKYKQVFILQIGKHFCLDCFKLCGFNRNIDLPPCNFAVNRGSVNNKFIVRASSGVLRKHMEFNFNLEGGNFSRAGAASSEIKKILKQLNVDALLIKRIVVALYEAEVNVVAHAYEGVMNVVLDGKSIVVTITDKGPGIPDIAKAMQEGFSTASPEVREMGFGAGMGLPNMKKNCDRLNIESTVNVGTKVTMTTYLR